MSVMLRNYEGTVKQVMFSLFFLFLNITTNNNNNNNNILKNDITLFHLTKSFHISGQ